MRAILTYHSIDPSGSVISVDADAFRRQVAWLAAGTVRVTTVPELLALPPDADAVALTFDDAFSNFAETAWPLLRHHRFPATLFVVTDRVGRTNAWRDRPTRHVPTLPLLDWGTLGRLVQDGVTLGAHSRTHRDLTTIAANELEDETAGAAERLQAETGVRPEAFAYPYGRVNAPVAQTVSRSYRWACTTLLGPLGAVEASHLLPRLDMYYFRAAGRLEAWGTARFRRYVWFRSQARRLRAALTARSPDL